MKNVTIVLEERVADWARVEAAKRRYWHPVIGYNYRMTNIAAAIGCAQLERISVYRRWS